MALRVKQFCPHQTCCLCRLYWSDGSKIETSNLDSSGRTILVDANLKKVVGLTVFGQNLYWADAQMDGGLVEGANKLDASKRKKIQSRVGNLRDLVSVISMEKSVLSKCCGILRIVKCTCYDYMQY